MTEKYNAIKNFESFKRSGNNMKEFLIDFDKRLYKIKNYITYPDDLLAYRLLKAANLDETHEKLIWATISDLKYEEVHSKLVSSLYAKASNEGECCSSQDRDEENTYYMKKQGRFYKQVIIQNQGNKDISQITNLIRKIQNNRRIRLIVMVESQNV